VSICVFDMPSDQLFLCAFYTYPDLTTDSLHLQERKTHASDSLAMTTMYTESSVLSAMATACFGTVLSKIDGASVVLPSPLSLLSY
jgi:hypothetical protein